MVAKIKTNDHGDCIFTEQDAIDIIYKDPEFDISKLFFESTTQYNSVVSDLGLDLPRLKTVLDRVSVAQFDQDNCGNWHMPDKYYKINVLQLSLIHI